RGTAYLTRQRQDGRLPGAGPALPGAWLGRGGPAVRRASKIASVRGTPVQLCRHAAFTWHCPPRWDDGGRRSGADAAAARRAGVVVLAPDRRRGQLDDRKVATQGSVVRVRADSSPASSAARQ